MDRLYDHESHIADHWLELDGNPAFTVYDVDPDTYDIMDAKVYIGKMTSQIIVGHIASDANTLLLMLCSKHVGT